MPKIKLNESDYHSHIIARMSQRGINKEEVEETLNNGWQADDVKPETYGKAFVFLYKISNSLGVNSCFTPFIVTVYERRLTTRGP